MARQTREIRIGVEGKRDQDKLFVVTEMSAAAAEKWGRRAFQALARAGLDILPDEIEGANLAMIAGFGFKALASAPTDEIDWLMAQLMACVVYVPDPANPAITRGGSGQPLFENDIEEYATRLRLQKEAFELSLGFSIPVVKPVSLQGQAAATSN